MKSTRNLLFNKWILNRENCSRLLGENVRTIANESSLQDQFHRKHTYLRISLTERCNLRCKYCMPSNGVTLTPTDKLLTTAEVIRLAKLFVANGVNKIRLTGGEPTIRKDIIRIIGALREIPNLNTIAMTTNGMTLTKHLVGLQRAGLDALNISLDTMRKDRFESLTRRKGWERVIAGIDLALQLKFNPVKVNCVVMKDFNEDELIDFVEFTKDRKVDVRFIEYMPFDGNNWNENAILPYAEIIRRLKAKYSNLEKIPTINCADTSKPYKVKGYCGQIGFITSMTDNFCNTCNRMRLLADGGFKVCLFGQNEINLRDAIRSGHDDDYLLSMIKEALGKKAKQHAGTRIAVTNNHYPRMSEKKVSDVVINKLLRKANKLKSLARYYSDVATFTHSTSKGEAKMVDVSHKKATERYASAKATVRFPSEVYELICENNLEKGNVLAIAQFAGITAAKKCADLIPLCHNISLSSVDVSLKMDEQSHSIVIWSEIRCLGLTGVEMEALTAVTVAALTVYDMCKSVSHDIRISDVCLIEKKGGKNNYKR